MHALRGRRNASHTYTFFCLLSRYDKDEQEGLQTPEFSKMCWDLMGGEGMTEEFFTRLVTEEFFHADSDHDGQVSMDEFQVYYWSRLRFFFPVNPTAYSSSGHAADSECNKIFRPWVVSSLTRIP